MSKTKYENREAWLAAAVELMKPTFKLADYTVPKVRVSCGWPSSGGTAEKKRTIGQCWSRESATDETCQIFISPWLIAVDEPQGVLPTLVHEVVHAVVGIECKHNKVFGKCARSVGLEGKLTATLAGEKLLAEIKHWVKSLGEYPHARLDSFKSPVKKQTTRMIKCECSTCGYTVRTSKKWLDEAGAPLCPCTDPPLPMSFALPEGDADDDGGDE